MDLKKEYGFTDPNLERDGVEVELDDGAFITVRRTNNEEFGKYLRALRKPYERKIQRGKMDQTILDNLTRKAVAKHVLIGWRGIEVGGEPVEYSPENAEKLMKEYDEFQEDVLTAANTAETFRAEVTEENEKNS